MTPERTGWLLLAWAAGLGLAACATGAEERCTTRGDCGGGRRCVEGRCVAAEDAGRDGSGSRDAAPEAGRDAAADAGSDARADAGSEAGTDASVDAASDGARDGAVDAAEDAAPPPGPPRNCAEVLARDPGAADGVYLIDPDGAGPGGMVAVTCDMSRDGGGWTLCAVGLERRTFAAHELRQGETSNWFGCDLLLPEGVERFARLRVITESVAGTYTDLYRDVPFGESRPATDGETNLTILRDTAACSRRSPGNFQWFIGSRSVLRYGIDRLRYACSTPGTPAWSIFAKATVSDGCAADNQIVPFVAYPCGSYGDRGVKATLWYRPATP